MDRTPLRSHGVSLGLVTTLLLTLTSWCPASSLAPTTEADDVRAALGICRGRITAIESFRHPVRGGIFTRVRISTLESIKGKFAASFAVIQRGGKIGKEGESNGLAASVAVGDERLFHVVRRDDGSLELLRGYAGAEALGAAPKGRRVASRRKLKRVRKLAAATGPSRSAPITGDDFSGETGARQANSGTPTNAVGLLSDANNIPARFLAPDRGDPIGYLVDAEALPAGITQAQALTAVSEALATWSAETGIAFRYDGLQNFGVSAADVAISDGRLRIQLHDLHGEITGTTTLGIGGRATSTVSTTFNTTGGGGGQVDGLEFHKTVRAYVVLEHTDASMETLATFEEVLCHEVGHALGMAHSSEDDNETDATLREAMMYYKAHADGRGASLGAYDGPVIQKVHPPLDTPPWSYDRIMTLVTAPSPITPVAGLNEIQLFGCDLQSPSSSLALITTGPSFAGPATFSFTGSTLRLTQTGYYGDADVDPASSSFYQLKWVRFSDGVNCSPWSQVRVTSLRADSRPSGAADGLPDSWMLTHFGNTTPSAGALSRTGDDKDGDGLDNLTEFLIGTSPIDPQSRLNMLSLDSSSLRWSATPYLLYTIESSTDLSTWTRFGNPVLPTTSTGQADRSFISPSTARRFYRVRFAP